jgi:5-methylcytosine-specific restriction endonuclease McrA
MKVAIRKLVFERDKHCKECGTSGSTGNRLTIHHIKPKFLYPQLVNEPTNLVVLCQHCHEVAHGISRKIPRRNNGRYWRREMGDETA